MIRARKTAHGEEEQEESGGREEEDERRLGILREGVPGVLLTDTYSNGKNTWDLLRFLLALLSPLLLSECWCGAGGGNLGSCQRHAQMNFQMNFECMSLLNVAAVVTPAYFRDTSFTLLDLKQQLQSTSLTGLQRCKQRRGKCEERRANQF